MTATTHRTLPPHTLRALAVYIVAIVVALALLEGAIRMRRAPQRLWYPAVADQAAGRPLRTLFVGTSRVQASIDPGLVSAALPPSGPTALDVNAGQGFSTIIEHTLGLRYLAERGLLRGTTVFVEVPAGSPDTSRWTDRWYYIEMPDFLLSVIRFGDMPALWRSSMSREEKIAATVRGSMRWSKLVTYHELYRVRFLTDVDRQFRAWSRALAQWMNAPRVATAPAASLADLSATPNAVVSTPPAQASAMMREGGGVRTDGDELARIRAEAVADGQRMLREQELITDWNARVVSDLVQTVRDGGGTVVFFETPLSEPMRLVAETPAGIENRRTFATQAEQWGMRIIPLTGTWPDDQFPDVWHLSVPASKRFTSQLMAAWRPSSRP